MQNTGFSVLIPKKPSKGIVWFSQYHFPRQKHWTIKNICIVLNNGEEIMREGRRKGISTSGKTKAPRPVFAPGFDRREHYRVKLESSDFLDSERVWWGCAGGSRKGNECVQGSCFRLMAVQCYPSPVGPFVLTRETRETSGSPPSLVLLKCCLDPQGRGTPGLQTKEWLKSRPFCWWKLMTVMTG